MGQLNARLEDLPHPSSLADLSASPATKGELTQVSAALQPDRPQVIVQLLQGGRAAHLQIQPEIVLPGILYAQMVERLFVARLDVAGGNYPAPRWASSQVPWHAAL